MLQKNFWLYIIKFFFVTFGVYLSFKFVLPVLLPFLLAYLAVYHLQPAMDFARNRLKLPSFLASYGTLVLSMGSILTLLSLLFWKIAGQLKLLFANLPVYAELLSTACETHFQSICKCLDQYMGLDCGTTTGFLETRIAMLHEKYPFMISEKAGKTLLSCLTSSIHGFVFLGFFVVSMFLLVKEIDPLRKSIRKNKQYLSLHLIYDRMKKSGLTYLKVEFMILFFNWVLCSFGIFLLQNPYFFLIGGIIAILDALPIIGSGLFLVPWGIFSIVQGDYYAGTVLLVTFLTTLFVREILEAKLLGKGMGINPFIMLLSIYVGMHLFGASGIFLGPVGVVLIQTLLYEEPES